MSLFNDNGSFAETPGGTGSSQTGGQSGADNRDRPNDWVPPAPEKTTPKAETGAPGVLDIASGALTGATIGSSVLGPVGALGGALAGGLYTAGYNPLSGLSGGIGSITPDNNQNSSIMAANESNQNEGAGGGRAPVSSGVSPGVGVSNYQPSMQSMVPVPSVNTLPGSTVGAWSAYGGTPALPTDIYGLASGFVNQDNPMMRAARTAGLQQANSRGLLNSSMGIEAAQKSAIDAALPAAAQMSQQNNATNLQRENIAAYDREKAASLAAAYESTYTGLFSAIMNNPNIPAAARENYLAQIGRQRDSNLGLLEQFYGIKLDWGTA